MNKSTSKMPLVYVITIITLLVIVGASSYIASTNTEAKLNSVIGNVLPLSSLSEELLVDLINMETGLRGFEVTGEEKYLEPHYEGMTELQLDLERMNEYQKLYPRIGSVMEADLLPQIRRLQDHYSSQINLIRAGQKDLAIQRVGTGKTYMDRYRQLHTKLKTEIDIIADEAHKSALLAESRSRLIISAGSAIAVIVGLYSAFIFHRANRAEAALRKSEETYRFMAESLEVQNEEIIAQQEEQEATLEKLSLREQELEAISTYQEKLTGAKDMEAFLEASLPALLASLKLEAGMLVMKKPGETPADEPRYVVQYALGYPQRGTAVRESELHGAARRVMTEKSGFEVTREATEAERGFHYGVTYAVDRYCPLLDDRKQAVGFLLLTGYQRTPDEQKTRLSKGLLHQFELAFQVQQFNEDRRQQAAHLEQLNEQLQHEKRLIEEQNNLIGSILESTHESMMMTDAAGNILFANSKMNVGNRIGDNIGDVYKFAVNLTPQLASTYEAIQALLRGERDQLTERFHYPNGEDGQLRHFELYASKVEQKLTNEVQGYLFVFRDRTEEEKVDEMKNEFISIVSHELRTPLASVLGFIEILLHRQLPAEKQQRYMQTIYKEATRLSTLINDFLDLQRMEAGKQVYHLVPVELGGIVQEVAEQWRTKQGHEILLEMPPQEIWVRGDADRLKQIVHNLLSNAVKYSPQADRVEVTLRTEQGEALLDIQDYGLGIPEDARDKLFNKFYRVDNSDRRQIGGTGLGLAIVKEIAEAHEGTITYESVMGEGTTFTFRLPSIEMLPSGGRILIVEDDENLAKLIGDTLGKLELPVTHVRSAEEAILALDRTEGEGPRLCVVDIMLDGTKSGWDFLLELYRHPQYHRTPVIVSTALDQPQGYREKEREKFLRKPFTMEKLLQVAEHLLTHTERHPAYVFMGHDELAVASSLERNGIEIREITRRDDHIEVEPRPAERRQYPGLT
ncbi:PhoR [Paenibacillus mucilaginosus 3016]|uniref:histidine kinase n=1 Tax=Paenibacillus mucilaginosus 3016 TaxID=1116391 RepID=H6NBL7_9BACL|nr:ATP-binding protein [Paenibacillus mucilaginosus]AFC33786.1 PhoR [Paenibacillus mucilaginosus 3016]WFA22179.1 response regulator [Paenibacillus mucilaginosus]